MNVRWDVRILIYTSVMESDFEGSCSSIITNRLEI
nr:MAG TPA: hypothetical protein [Caudoviricetes sp.]